MTLTFKIQLKGVTKPPVWRKVKVPDSISFHEFHLVIQDAFGWGNSHLYQFSPTGYGSSPLIQMSEERDTGFFDLDDEELEDEEAVEEASNENESGDSGTDDDEDDIDDDGSFEEDGFNSKKIPIATIFRAVGTKFTYIYDFGDDWTHKIELEAVSPELMDDAICLSGKGACPPDDCGGIYGYERLKQTMKDPKDPEYADMKEWLGLEEDDEFDPNEFDLELINPIIISDY